jgi:lysophospholipase L1-like esterase
MTHFTAITIALTAISLLAQTTRAAEEKKDHPVSCKPVQKDPQRHEQFLKDKAEALKKGPIDLLFVGDSITDGWRNKPQNKLYVEKWSKHNPLNIGISGDKTQHVLWRLENGEVDGIEPKLIVLMIGTNNLGNAPQATPEETAAGVTCVVKKLQEKLPKAKLLLLAVFPRGEKADNAFRGQIKTVNDTIAKLDDGKQVKYLDIADKFLDDDGTLPKDVMPDALHPNAKGYEIWADAIAPVIDEMMK